MKAKHYDRSQALIQRILIKHTICTHSLLYVARFFISSHADLFVCIDATQAFPFLAGWGVVGKFSPSHKSMSWSFFKQWERGHWCSRWWLSGRHWHSQLCSRYGHWSSQCFSWWWNWWLCQWVSWWVTQRCSHSFWVTSRWRLRFAYYLLEGEKKSASPR